MPVIDVPVLIIGGGGCGLSASIFLSDLGVEHLLVERHPMTSNLPKAHYLNQRTMEMVSTHFSADLIDAGIGLIPGAPVEANIAAFHALFSDTLMGSALRARAAEAIGTQRFEFQAHDVEIGYGYEAGAVIADGTPPPPRSATGTVYTPTTHPGYRLPHAWIDQDGQRLSTHDLAGRSGGFLLITGRGEADWGAAAEEAADKFGVAVTIARIGAGCDYGDLEGAWAKACGISEAGAVLVRPDNHIAWRCQDAAERPGEIITGVFAQVLAR